MSNQNELAVLEKQYEIIEAKQKAEFALTPVGQMLRQFETLQRMGQMYAQSTIVPDTYNAIGIFNNLLEKEKKIPGNQPDIPALQKQAQGIALANCAIALDMATRMKANPVMVMQNLYIVHGNPSWSSKFLIATINTCGRFLPLMYECNNEKGDNYGWRCYTYASDDKERKNRLDGTWITWAMVKSEGWDTKKGSKWATMPEQMFKYRAAAFWQRMYAPEISMGFNTVEENQEIQDVDYEDLSPSMNERSIASKKSISEIARQAAINNSNKPEEAPSPVPETAEEQPANNPEPQEQEQSTHQTKQQTQQRTVAQQTADAAEFQRKKAEEMDKRFAKPSQMFGDENEPQN